MRDWGGSLCHAEVRKMFLQLCALMHNVRLQMLYFHPLSARHHPTCRLFCCNSSERVFGSGAPPAPTPPPQYTFFLLSSATNTKCQSKLHFCFHFFSFSFSRSLSAFFPFFFFYIWFRPPVSVLDHIHVVMIILISAAKENMTMLLSREYQHHTVKL